MAADLLDNFLPTLLNIVGVMVVMMLIEIASLIDDSGSDTLILTQVL